MPREKRVAAKANNPSSTKKIKKRHSTPSPSLPPSSPSSNHSSENDEHADNTVENKTTFKYTNE